MVLCYAKAMFRLFFVCVALIFPPALGAEGDRLGQIGMQIYAAESFGISRNYVARKTLPARRRTEPVSLMDSVSDGVSMGVVKLRRGGDLCVDFRKAFRNCVLAVTRTELLVFRREAGRRLPITMQMGIRP